MSNPSNPSVELRLERLERKLAFHRKATLAGVILLASIACTATLHDARTRADRGGILRVQGLVIEDALGRARVLIGAPVPSVAERTRRDPAVGVVVLSEDGRDRVQLGNVGGPQMGGTVQPRMSPGTGLIVNDASGDERAGFGAFENGQVGWGLDYASGREAIVAAVMPDGALTGILISADAEEGAERILLSTSKDSGASLSMNDTAGAQRIDLAVKGREAPALRVLDEKGAVVRDALRP